MTSATDVANLALLNIGTRSTIESLTETSAEARVCNQYYNLTRRQLLRMAYWGFARAFINLALIKSAPGTPENPNPSSAATWSPAFPPQPWLFEYAYPDECLMARYVVPAVTQQVQTVPIFSSFNPSAWQILGPPVKSIIINDKDGAGNKFKAICTNQDQATLCFTEDITEPDLWDAMFHQALVDVLGARVTLGLTGDKNLAKLLVEQANTTIMQARQVSANEALSQQDSVPDWIRVRSFNYGYSGYTSTLESFGPLFPTPT